MNLFFDLDGTLIDSRARLYKLFQYLVHASDFSFEQYWELKRNKINHKQILKNKFSFSNDDIDVFEKEWMARIELPDWIALDKPFNGITEYLQTLKKKHRLYILTARQFEKILLKQINQYGWTGVFEKIFITNQKYEKYDLLKDAGIVEKDDWLIGDTGKDIETGKRLSIHTAAVTSGFLSKERLMEYQPDVIADSVLELTFS